MKISTFKEDLLGLIDFANRLEQFIAIEHEYVEGSLVLALTSKYGSGKTTFLEMWKNYLESRDESSNRPLVISLNAWESDYYGDPLFAIISALIECLQENGKSVKGLVDAAKNFGWFATAIGNQIVHKVTGIDVVAAGALAEKKEIERNVSSQTVPDSFSIYQDRKSAMESLKIEIKSFVAASEPRVLFLVDELDRCRPDYAITYLETIKHIFDIKGAVFLLAADRRQLENSAKSAFGQNLDFEEYYRKFVHREISLPSISNDGYQKITSKYVNFYLEKECSRYCYMNLDYYKIKEISTLVCALKLTLRQIQEVFRILGHILSTSEDKKGRLFWGLSIGSVLMTVLKVGDPKMFYLLGTQQLNCKELTNYLEDLIGSDNVDWWFKLLITGGGIHIPDGDTLEDLMIREGYWSDENEATERQSLSQFEQGWGHYRRNRISEIHDKIEHILQWN